jgi:aminopeptidase N
VRQRSLGYRRRGGRHGEGAVATWHLAPGPPLCTYHGALIAGEYYRTEQAHTTPAGQRVTLGLACRQSLAQYLEPDDVLAVTRAGLDYYTGLIGTPFPVEKYDQVYVPEFPAGANSCPGCIAVSEQYLFRSRVSQARYEARTTVILQGELPVLSLVRTLAASMGCEQSASVLQSLLDQTRLLMSQLADPATVPQCQDALAVAALRLLWQAEPGSDRQLAWAQLLTWTARPGEQLDLLAGLLDGTASVPGLTVDAELRWALLLRLATTGRARDPQIDAEVARDSTDEGRRHALACRAAIGDAAHKAAAWRLLTQQGELGATGTAEVARAFAQPEQAALVAPYAGEYFAMLPALWASRSDMLTIFLGKVLFPYTAAGPELLARIEEFLRAEQRDPGLVRIVIEGRDIVEKALRARTWG